jgi:glycosyltransferase involved in cell wall biosynthesis
MANPPVSVVLTCYNLEQYIGDAIRSVLAQDYEGEMEIVVVDDCSTDRSREEIAKFPSVRLVSQPGNGGVLLATLAGIEAARHDLVAFLDGDDIWEPAKVRTVAELFAADERMAFVTHDLHYAGSDGEPRPGVTRPQAVLSSAPTEARGELIRDGILHHRDYVWLGSALTIRRSAARATDFVAWARDLPDAKNTYQDWPLAFWIASLPDVTLGYSDRKLFRYRLHGLNYSGDAATVEKAVRNHRRTRNTVDAMRQIALMRGLPRRIVASLEERAGYCQGLVDLYSGRRGASGRAFVRSLGFLRRQGLLAKELGRLIGVQLLGPERFSRLAATRRGRS